MSRYLLRREKREIKLIYLDLYKELKKDFPDKVAQVYLSSRIKSHLMKYGMYNKSNIAYLTGFFRNNKVLIYDSCNGYLKWK